MTAATAVQLFSINESASRLNVCPATLRRWSLAGKIAFHKIGSQIMFSEADLTDFVRNSRIARIAV
jgi:excisionase family DNA binding protein